MDSQVDRKVVRKHGHFGSKCFDLKWLCTFVQQKFYLAEGELHVTRYMCGVTFQYKRSSDNLTDRLLGIKCV
jgi:hypothetical protein